MLCLYKRLQQSNYSIALYLHKSTDVGPRPRPSSLRPMARPRLQKQALRPTIIKTYHRKMYTSNWNRVQSQRVQPVMSKHWMQEIPPTHSCLYACLYIQSNVQTAYGNGFAICPMKFYSNTLEDVYEYKQTVLQTSSNYGCTEYCTHILFRVNSSLVLRTLSKQTQNCTYLGFSNIKQVLNRCN